MYLQDLNEELVQYLLKEGLQVVQSVNLNTALVFPIHDSGRIVFDKGLQLDDDMKCFLYDMVLVAKFYCKTGSWIDRITLSGGQLWVWTCGQLPLHPCHIVVQLEPTHGTVLFPDGNHVKSSSNGLCFGLVFNNL